MSSINSINIHSSVISNYKADELSSSTKLKLEALGIDPSSVKTEAQAQLIISQAEAANKQQNSSNEGGTQQQLLSDAKKLAEHVGVSISNQDTLEDILEKISETLQTMANDPSKAKFVQDAQEKLAGIAQRANIMVNIQQNIFNEMNMISISNRLIHGL